MTKTLSIKTSLSHHKASNLLPAQNAAAIPHDGHELGLAHKRTRAVRPLFIAIPLGRLSCLVVVLLLASTALLAGCALQTSSERSGEDQAEFDGVWEGMTINDCSTLQVDSSRCRATERISFTVVPQNANLWGFYGCAPLTTPCYKQVEHGEIKGLWHTGHRLWMRVMRDDHSSCLFSSIPSNDRMAGGFWCFDGAALIERGYWQVDRAY